ncbi:MAG: single-stranded-DNA-specific exonuclease RecJ [Chloroflexaceae bacterium]|nr:single-stranded-DNA-specific exonuclease RecJ [Chloroflexaceae bacterium]
MNFPRLPQQRWQIAAPDPQVVEDLSQALEIPVAIAQVLVNRGITTRALAEVYLRPETEKLPEPLLEFPDLRASVALLAEAIAQGHKIAICGDYDADGMTSTALLLRALRHLGAAVDYAIPSRMKDGYGINDRIVEAFHQAGVQLILTVDNGIAAVEAIAKAVGSGMKVIVTDHHDLPAELPPATAILNPKLLPETSPYRGIAGVGVAYILAVTLAQQLSQLQGLTEPLLELLTLGTIADLAPLVGVNRRWLKRGLKRLPQSSLAGIQALMQMAGVSEEQKQLRPDDIGFRLGPRINAIGRLDDPQIVIELLVTDDPGVALERAMQCEQVNRKRQLLCEEIEGEALALIADPAVNWQQERVLVLCQSHWHHGVIGIVASRLVERYGVPVFMCTEESGEHLRGSARGIEEFDVFEALNFCGDLLGKYGGHHAAGGFSLMAEKFLGFRQRLSEFAHRCLQPHHLKPSIKPDAYLSFSDITRELFNEIESLQPWGIGNEFPIFWTPEVQILKQQIVGKKHLKVKLRDRSGKELEGIAWRWGEYHLPSRVDVAYKLQENRWNGLLKIELELVGVRLPQPEPMGVRFEYQGYWYNCCASSEKTLKIDDNRGNLLIIYPDRQLGILKNYRQQTRSVTLSDPGYSGLVQAAIAVLNKSAVKSKNSEIDF